MDLKKLDKILVAQALHGADLMGQETTSIII